MVTLVADQETCAYKTQYPAGTAPQVQEQLNNGWKNALGVNGGGCGESVSIGANGCGAAAPMPMQAGANNGGAVAMSSNCDLKKDAEKAAAELEADKQTKIANDRAKKDAKKAADELEKVKNQENDELEKTLRDKEMKESKAAAETKAAAQDKAKAKAEKA